MKHALLVAMVAVASVSTLAQKPATTFAEAPKHRIPTAITPADVAIAVQDKVQEGTQAVSWSRVFGTEVRAQFHYWPYGNVSNNMFKYDPISNTLNIARNRALFNASNTISGVELGIVRSSNMGSSWNFDVIQSTTAMFFGMPVIGWVNPNELTDASKIPITVYGIRYPTPALSYGGLSMWTRTDAEAYELTLNDQPSPAFGYSVYLGDLYSDNVNGAVHYAGTLNPDPNIQYGAYGYFNFNLTIEDFGQVPTIPSQWALDKFTASPGIGTTFNAPATIEGDDNGNLYTCFNNRLAGSEDPRTVAVTKSTNGGSAWSPFNAMPVTLLDQFASQYGGDIGFQPGLSPYDGGAFIVTGPDQYSYFFRLVSGIRSLTAPGQVDSLIAYHIVEAAYKSGAWSLRPVAELQSLEHSMYSINDSLVALLGVPSVVVEDNGRGHEIQVARTKDRNSLVVKWVDIVPTRETHKFSPPIRSFTSSGPGVYAEGTAIAELFDTDIFVVTRGVNSSSWGSIINITDDTDMAFRTYMPEIIPSTGEIPLLRMLGTNTGTVTSQMPRPSTQIIFNGGANIEFTMAAAVVSVENERNYHFRFGNVAPNPVLGSAEVTFTLDRPAVVSVDVFNMVGSHVRSINVGNLQAGPHGLMVDATDLATGTYNVALTVDGIRIMKPFVVVR